jgi:hypothetical protein
MLVLLGALAALGFTTNEVRAEGAWCMVATSDLGFENCGYFTQRQCLAAVSGVGGFCVPNPRPPGYYADSFEVRRWKRGKYPF